MNDQDYSAVAVPRLERARRIRERLIAVGQEHGRWVDRPKGSVATTGLFVINTGEGWEAIVAPGGYEEVLAPAPAEPCGQHATSSAEGKSMAEDATVDLLVEPIGKVLSISRQSGIDCLIGMLPGPWEALFGLPERPWSPGVARRLQAKGKITA